MTEGRKHQFSLRRMLISVAIIAFVFSLLLFAKRVIDVPFDAYKNWAMGDLIVAFMEEHDGAWPSDWDDLRPTCKKLGGRLIGGETFDSLQRAVDIDFEFAPESAADAIDASDTEPVFCVIWLKNGSTAHYEGDEPNQRVFDFLKTRKFGGG